NGAFGQETIPDGTSYKESYGTTWQQGLTVKEEFFAAGNPAVQKTTNITWEQDDQSISYQVNPRVTEVNITDPNGNHQRTRTAYETTLGFHLPSDVFEYNADAVTVLRRTHTDYNLDAAYTSRRIIGLPSTSYLYDGGTDVGGGQLVSQVSYLYDQTDAGRLVDTPAQASQHDSAYGTSFATGRANVTSVRRVDVTNTNQYLESTAGYDTTGNVVFSRDPVGHQTSVSYADVFVDQTEQPLTGLTISTYAYPTTVTDPDGFTATTKYDYDMGAVRQVQTPLPNVTTNQPGPVQTEQYDDAGRVVKVFNS